MIDPIQFRPYNPRKDNAPIYVPDKTQGIRENTQRVLRDMDYANRVEQRNDQSRIANAQIAAQNLQNLGQFSETLAKAGEFAMNEYIKYEEERASNEYYDEQFGAGQTDAPKDPSLEQEEADANADQAATTQGIQKYEESGGSAIIGERVRKGSWWYQRKRDQLELQEAASNFPAWYLNNKDNITININGVDKGWKDLKDHADFAAFKKAVFGQFLGSFSGYDRRRVAKYLYPALNKQWGAVQENWLKTRQQEIQTDRKQERMDNLRVSLAPGTEIDTGALITSYGGRMEELGADMVALATVDPSLAQHYIQVLTNGEYAHKGQGGKLVTLSQSYGARLGKTLSDLRTLERGYRQQQDSNDREVVENLRERLIKGQGEGEVMDFGMAEEIYDQLTPSQQLLFGNDRDAGIQAIRNLTTDPLEANTESLLNGAEEKLGLGQQITQREAEILKEKNPNLYQSAAEKGLIITAVDAIDEDTDKEIVSGVKGITTTLLKGLDPAIAANGTPETRRANNRLETEVRSEYQRLMRTGQYESADALQLALDKAEKNFSRDSESYTSSSVTQNDDGSFDITIAPEERVDTYTKPGSAPINSYLWSTRTEREAAMRHFSQGDVGLPPIFQQLATATGGIYTATELARKQLERAGDPIPVQLQAQTDMISEVPPDIRQMLRVPTPVSAQQAVVQAGTPVEGGEIQGLTQQDYRWLAYAVSGEAAAGADRYAVAASILNRVADPRWPNTVQDVVMQANQYEAVTIGTAKHDDAFAAELASPEGQQQLFQQLTNLDGRTNFKGQSELGNRGASDYMATPDGNFFHYAEEEGAGPGFVYQGPKPQGWRRFLRSAGEPTVPVAASQWNTPQHLDPRLAKAVYKTGNIGPTSTGAHLDVKQTNRDYFEPDDLDPYVQVNDPEFGMVPLSKLPVTSGFYSMRDGGTRQHSGYDYGAYSGTNVYLTGGAQVVMSRPTQHGDVLVISTPDGREYQLLHGRAA